MGFKRIAAATHPRGSRHPMSGCVRRRPRCILVLIATLAMVAEAFTLHPPCCCRCATRACAAWSFVMSATGDAFDSRSSDASERIPGRVGGAAGDWRIERSRLDHQQSARVRRRAPRYPSFAASSAVAQSLGLSSKEEWEDWLELGEGWSPYLPRDPERYYTERLQWLGWTQWLTGEP